MTLAEYRSSKDPNLYWRLSDADRQNLLEEAIEEIDKQKAKLRELVESELSNLECPCCLELYEHDEECSYKEDCPREYDDLEWMKHIRNKLEAVLKEAQ